MSVANKHLSRVVFWKKFIASYSTKIPTKETPEGLFVLSKEGKVANRILSVLPSGFEQANVTEITVFLRENLDRWSNTSSAANGEYFPGSIIGGPNRVLQYGVPGVKQPVARGFFGSLYVEVPSKAIIQDYLSGKFVPARKGRCYSGSVYDLRIATKDTSREWYQRVVARHFDLHHITVKPNSILFVRCIPNSLYKIRLPVVLLNENKCEGLKTGHLLRYHRAVDAVTENIDKPPAAVFADLAKVPIDTKIFVRDLLVPPGVQIWDPQDKEMFYLKPEREDKEASEEEAV
eukprot:jgi/Galph1/2998/GphlegSOOS_G1688.1